MIQVYVDLCRIEVPVVVIIPAAVFRVCNKDPGSGVEGGAHCDYFYNGDSYSREDVTARGVFHSARDPYAIEETSRRWRRGPLAGD